MAAERGAPDHRSLTDLRGRPVLVAGAGVSGLAVAEALVELGALVTVTDGRADRLTELPQGARAEVGLDVPPPGTELVVTSPGWRPDAPLLKASADAGIEVIGEPELAWRWTAPGGPAAEGPAPRWLAVTGTNGKTTTVGMLESILVTSGRNAIACGNVGTPVIEAVRAGHRELAVELSSFQLYWSPSLRPAAGCLLNIAEDHLDWHGGMDGYLTAKARVLTGQVAVAGADDPLAAGALAASRAERRIGVTLGAPARGQLGVVDGTLVDNAFGDGVVELLGVDELPLTGPPAQLDALAAAALARSADLTAGEVAAGLRAFRPGPHRGSVVATVDGVRFVDDSKATNPHAADAALSGHRRVVWIAGGQLKGASVTELIHQHAHRLVGVVLMGTDRAMFGDALLRHAPDVPVQEVLPGEHEPMTDAVRRAAAMAAPGDVVLLAPAAASLDQFTGYAARGLAFADAASGLRKSGSGTPSGNR
ncbi:UDP-N-acetylmuramoyl-L-alanine--D-glutamate ligase [Pseudonocardia spinosispora]|uniref:UDP-N-acetylmuramoyl-L-alanine--D-glutamate ligase n=1 Tax=Pseudonocardia spinosispora TaxID=103441 RepID=UPI000417483A|nr:UDP-N-acetylmuramoyl-L-alanine--D-glutamate ligase [Pseudonocardia spinosispora]